jgi:TolB-like protein/ketosteroid isomerase-like protein
VGGASEDTWVGGAAAVLVATLSAGDTPPAERLEPLLALLVAVVREAGGEAERATTDGIVAAFPSVGSGVAAALEIHRRLRLTDLGDNPIEERVGVLALETVLSPDGEVLAAAVAMARELAAAARPGTLVFSERARDALPSDAASTVERIDVADMRAYLLAPPPMGPPLARRTVLSGLAGAAALGAIGAAVALSLRRITPTVDPRPIALGVLRFRAPGVAESDLWIRDAVRDSLNTQLAELDGVRVYSREFLDFLMTRQGLSEIETATKLGIEKMLAGVVTVGDDAIHVDTQIVDIASGVIEGSFTRDGRRSDVLALENEVVFGVVEKLGLRLTPEDEGRLAARRATDVEALRRLMRVEGGKPAPPRPGPPPLPTPDGSSWMVPRDAWADDEALAEREIVAFLERYRRATEAGDVAALATMYATFTPAQRAALVSYYASVRNLQVTIDNLEIAVVGDEAVVSYSRTDDFVDVQTGRPMHVALRVTKTLSRAGGGWVFATMK